MRTSLALVIIGCAALAGGCGDNNNSGADMSMSADLSMPGGVPSCAGYCAKIAMNCTSSSDGGGGNAQYTSTAACNTYCTTSAAWLPGTTGATSGNTVGCRLYHAGAAAAEPALHCPHAGPTGGNTCGTWCENYCQLLAK